VGAGTQTPGVALTCVAWVTLMLAAATAMSEAGKVAAWPIGELTTTGGGVTALS